MRLEKTFSFLDGGGSMGENIRAFDWKRSPLGPIEHWPQSLKTSVGLMLNSQHPMWIGWGPEATFLYNDAYIQVLSQAKHPWALGKPAATVWAEIWNICGPLADKVFQKAEASFVNDVRLFMSRGDFLEETFYSFSYSPIRDESGGVGGLFCPSAEVTSKVLNARRLQTLSELAAKSLVEKTTASACSSAAAILAKNADDIPFMLLYLFDANGKALTLEQAIGIEKGLDASPESIPPGAPVLWPVDEVLKNHQPRVVSIGGVGGFPAGLAGQKLSQAVVLPVLSGGQEKPWAILIVGANAARKLDSEYLRFFELVAGHIATAIQNAHVAEEERQRLEMLAELDRAKTTFFSNVSHEFRTPLTLMLGQLEDLLARKQPPGAMDDRAELEVIHRNSLRLLKLVNTLLDFSRIEAGRAQAVFVETDLATLTADLASVFRAAVEKAGLTFTVDCPPLPRPVFVDRDMWEKIVFNLLSNAFKFTFSGEIGISLRAGRHGVILKVWDTGIGISAAELPKIFKRFYRIENARGRSHEGTGIGLALASELVRLHEGTTEVESAEGKGTTFQIRIPFGENRAAGEQSNILARSNPASQSKLFAEEVSSWLPQQSLEISTSSASALTTAGDAGSLGGLPRILLAEDNGDLREYILRLLGKEYAVKAVSNGALALEAARRNPPDLVLTDVMMPELDGFGLLKHLRNDASLRGIPVILLSARAGEESRLEGTDAGADDYLTKPFSARELLARVNAHVKLSRIRKKVEADLRETGERLQAALNAAGAGTFRWNIGDNSLEWDENLDRLFGLAPHETIRSLDNFVAAVHPEDREGVVEMCRCCAREGRDFDMSYRVVWRDGSTHWLHDKGKMFFDHAGRPTHMTGACLDITRHKLSEIAAAENAQRLHLALDAGDLGDWSWDAGTQILTLSERGSVIFGQAKEITHWTWEGVRELVHPKDRDRSRAASQHALATHSDYNIEYALNTHVAGERWVATRGRGIYGSDGKVIGMVGVVQDITERKRAAQALIEARLALAAQNQVLEDTVQQRTARLKETILELEAFSYTISHDMRAPLRAMQGYADALLEDYKDKLDPEAAHHLQRIHRAAFRLDLLIRDVLAYSRIAKGEIEFKAVDVGAVISEIVQNYPNLGPGKIRVEVSPLIPVMAHEALLTQIVSNLLGNAVKFSNPNVFPEVRISAERIGSDVRLWFADNGIGIDPQHHQRIFQIFGRIYPEKRYEGTGIGLAIVKKSAERMGGSAGVESELNKGSRFWVMLKSAE